MKNCFLFTIELISLLSLVSGFYVTSFTLHQPAMTTSVASRAVTMHSNKLSHSLHTVHDAVGPNHIAPKPQKPVNGFKSVLQQAKIVWDFTRPHTIIGSCVSVICLFLFAVPSTMWGQKLFVNSIVAALTPALFMNLYITGLNQLSDIKIDEINKPYLPLASGKLSRLNGTLIVFASLVMSLWNVHKAAWPLQFTLLGSALLGTLYSVPPFRLKRFPLLAAFCILVVRGSIVNLGFFLQAKMTVLGEQFIKPSSLIAAGSLFKQVYTQHPEAIALTGFFAVFGLVIALMKDVPDIRGDIEYKIPSFSVKLGAVTMFRTAWTILFGLLSTASVATLLASNALNPVLEVLKLTNPLSGVAAMTQTTQVYRVALSLILALFAVDISTRALKVEAEEPDKVFAYYMHIWNIFYACYLLLPIAAI